MKIITCFAMIICFSNLLYSAQKTHDETEDTFEAHLDRMQIDKEKYEIPEIVLGDKKAKFSLVVYSSFSCAHCRKFHKEELWPFIKKYVDTNKVKLILRYFIDDAASFEASAFVTHLSQGDDKIAFALMETIFENQDRWREASDQPKFLRDLLANKMQQLRPKSFEYYRQMEEQCLDVSSDIGKTIGARVMLGQKEADRMRISSIPCMIFNGKFDKYKCITNAACSHRIPNSTPETIIDGYCYQGSLTSEVIWKIASKQIKKIKRK